MLKKNDIITLKIEDITNLGFGVSRHGGIVVFVSDTIPGDEIKAKVIKVKDSYAVARCESYLKRSPLYDGTRCDNAKCRSCAYKSLSYSDELKLKSATVKSAFDKAGLHGIEVEEVFASPLTVGYRNKAQYPVSKDSQGNIVIGFYAPKSHNVCDACDCPLAPAEFADILKLLKAKIKEYGISVYDEKSSTGLLRHIYLRRSESSGEILLTLVVNGKAYGGYQGAFSVRVRNSSQRERSRHKRDTWRQVDNAFRQGLYHRHALRRQAENYRSVILSGKQKRRRGYLQKGFFACGFIKERYST